MHFTKVKIDFSFKNEEIFKFFLFYNRRKFLNEFQLINNRQEEEEDVEDVEGEEEEEEEEENCFKPIPKLTLSVCDQNEIVPLENALQNMNEVLKNLTLNAQNKVRIEMYEF
jgi:hypothetical protein